jgi:hypothetical protein
VPRPAGPEQDRAEDSSPCERTAREWGAGYERDTGNRLHEIDLGPFTYTFDTTLERLVSARGRSVPPTAPRDQARQRGHPRAPDGDHKGHVIAHSIGGGMDINIVAQKASVNLGGRWRQIEKLAAANPGTAVAVHLIYDDDSDRPAAFEYAVDDPEDGLRIERFDNR